MSAPDDSAHGARPIARPEGAGPGLSALLALDPLSPFAAIAPLAVVIAALSTPVPALWTLGVAAVVLVTADLRRGPVLVVVVLALAAIVGSALAVSAPIERVGASPVVIEALGVGLQRNQVLAGVRLGGKLGAVLSLLLLTGLLAGPRDLLRAMVIHLHVPYRIAYAGMAALGFRERFAIEYRVIQEAHALRGTRVSPSFLRPLVQRWTAVPALMAGAASSFMLGDRGPRMLQAYDGDGAEVRSSLNIFVKDMGIVTAAAKGAGLSTPVAAAAEQLYLQGAARGLGARDDSSVITVVAPEKG